MDGIGVVDPTTDQRRQAYASAFTELRKAKGMTLDQAEKAMAQPLFFAAMMIREGAADGSVAGSISTTGDVLRAAIQAVGVAEGISIVSSFFLMIFPNVTYTFADCAVVPDPTAEQLRGHRCFPQPTITVVSPGRNRVAMLSFSTKGSASHPDVEKVRATAILKRKAARSRGRW